MSYKGRMVWHWKCQTSKKIEERRFSYWIGAKEKEIK